MAKASFLPQKNDLPDVWVNWFDNLQGEVGLNNARFLWIKWWNEIKPTSSNTINLRNQMEARGVVIEPESALGKIGDIGSDVFSGIGTAFRGVGTLITISVVGGIAIIGLVLYNFTKDESGRAELKSLASKIATKGM
jgi:hypothetical protein